jgi:hypothetical protein
MFTDVTHLTDLGTNRTPFLCINLRYFYNTNRKSVGSYHPSSALIQTVVATQLVNHVGIFVATS